MTIIQHKRGISTNWTSSNPTLAVGEIGYETNTGKFKIGDGASAWSALPYFSTSAGGSGTVTSVDLSVPTGLSVSGNPVTTSGTLAISLSAGYAIPTTAKQTEWDTAYTDRLKWDGGSTGLDAATARTSLGLVIGTNVQAYDADLAGIASATLSSAGFLKTNGSGVYSTVTDSSSNWNTAYGWGNHASVGYLTSLGIGSSTQAWDADLDAVAALSGTGLAKRTGTNTWTTITDSSTNWDSAYTDRLKWDGGSSGLTASTGRTSLGATTVGSNLFTLTNPSATRFIKINTDNSVTAEDASTHLASLGATTVGENLLELTNPSAIRFIRINADNTVSALSDTNFRTAIGAGTGSGTVTTTSVVSANGFAGTVATDSTTPAITLTTTITGLLSGNGTAISAASAGYGDTTSPYGTKSQYYVLAGPVTPTPAAPTFRLLTANDIPDLSATYLGTGDTAASTTEITISTINGNTSDTTLYPVFVGGNTAISQAPHTDVAGIVYNASTDSLSLTGDLTVTGGDVLLGSTGTATTIKTLATTGTSSGSLTISTGDTTTSGNSGNITIDVGNGATSDGTIAIGNTYASAITIGRAGVTTTIDGTLSATVSNATSADTAKTVSTATNASFYPVFVDANNGTATAEALYTDAGLVYNPSTNKLSTGGDISVNGGDLETTSTGTATLFNTNATTLNIGGAATALTIGASTGTTTIGNGLVLAAGTTSLAPLDFSSSTDVLSSPVAGAVEYNNANFFATPFTTSGRGLIESNYFYSNLSSISIAGTSTGGASVSGSAFAVSLPLATSMAYQIEATLYLQTSYSVNAPASQTMTFSYPTGTTILAEGIIVQNQAAVTTQTTAGSFYAMQANTNRTITAVTVSGNWHRVSMRGIIRTSTNAGSFSINFGGTNGATPATLQLTLGANSFIKLTPVGSATSDNSIGAWA
jgi:hypothetical protein